MYSVDSETLSLHGVFFAFLALVIMFSFGLHAVQIHHEHFGNSSEHGEREHSGQNETSGFSMLDIAMHLADKKLLLLAVIGTIAFVVFQNEKHLIVRLLMSHERRARKSYGRYGNEFRIYDYVTLCLRKGTFHSKAY